MIILGTAQFGMEYGVNNSTGKLNEIEIFKILEYSYQKGIYELDTASNYGSSESVIGKFVRKNPNINFKINTKISSKSNALENQIKNSLERIHVPKINKLIFHSAELYNFFKKEIYDLNRKHKGNLFDKIGVSVYSNYEIKELLFDKNIDVIQSPFNIFDNINFREKIFKKLRKEKFELDIRSVFLQGLFFKQPEKLKGNFKLLKEPLIKLNKLSREYGLSIEAIAIGYVSSKHYVNKILIGVDSITQLKNNIKLLNKELPKDLIDEIEKIKIENTLMLNPSKWQKI